MKKVVCNSSPIIGLSMIGKLDLLCLHRGELEVMVAAKELKVKHVIIDDKSARYFAETMLLKTLGLMGIILLGKQKGKLSSVRCYMNLLIEKGYRISVKLYNQILELAKESEN